nr:hypothetical protein CFP56_62479 [Quercus suber]
MYSDGRYSEQERMGSARLDPSWDQVEFPDDTTACCGFTLAPRLAGISMFELSKIGRTLARLVCLKAKMRSASKPAMQQHRTAASVAAIDKTRWKFTGGHVSDISRVWSFSSNSLQPILPDMTGIYSVGSIDSSSSLYNEFFRPEAPVSSATI